MKKTILLTTLAVIMFAGPVMAGDVTVSCNAPTRNMDGSVLLPNHIGGYLFYYGTAEGDYIDNVDVPQTCLHTFTDLTEGDTYYFMMEVYDIWGRESDPSDEVYITVNTSGGDTRPNTPTDLQCRQVNYVTNVYNGTMPENVCQ